MMKLITKCTTGEYNEDGIKAPLIKIIIDFVKKKYSEEGWNIEVDDTNYILEFSEKGKKTGIDDDSVTRSELIDLEE